MSKPARPEEYDLEVFREIGFERRRGKRCPVYFWSLGGRHEEPPDTPCVEYRFNEIPARPGLGVSDARSLFIEFFRRRGHEPVRPRPVVARWREDLYLTIASIVVFQPHVTSGIVPPPANPLVISQPSIRLEDIDNVGVTIGRHLTSFEMAAHHAFNYPDKRVYWKEETVRLAYEFFTGEMGIPPEEIVFVESWWEGGGNAGPSFEVVVGGLELATLVFMKYRVEDGRYEEIPLKIVDTGYGVERLAWFSQKTPTAFHAIYGRLLEKYRGILGVEEPPRDVLWAAFRAAGRLDPEDPGSLRSYYERVARAAGLSPEEARSVLEREARLYSVLDHAKTLALMLGDGIVPSNSGEGYLARLVARRALKQLSLLGAGNASLAELVDLQIEYWGRDFPQLRENRDYILDAVSLEQERFREVIRRGAQVVRRILKKKKRITLEDLITLYDSHGLPPEIVAEEAAKLGVKVEVPHNFYALIAQRHRAPARLAKQREKTGLPQDIVEWARGLPATRKLYYENQYTRSFEATVQAVRGRYIVLDRTAFYPTGGGQLHDTGRICWSGGCARVVRVEKAGDAVVHVLEEGAQAPPPGARVWGEIDWPRRYRLMRHHTGTHVLLGALRRVLGSHVWQAGAEKTPEKARFDFTHHRPLTREQIREIERLVNRVIDEKRPVIVRWMPKNEAEEKYGFVIYQGGVPMQPVLRLVEVRGWDIEGCGGTHLSNTGEIGGFKIISTEKIQDGVIRIEFVAGTRAAEEAARLEDQLREAAKHLGAGPQQAVEAARRAREEMERMQEALRRYRRLWLEQASRVLEGSGRWVLLEAPEPDRREIQQWLRRLTEMHPDKVVGIYYRADGHIQLEIAAGREAGVDLGRLVREVAPRHGARGGGRGTYASVRVPEEKLEDLWRDLSGGQ